MSCININHPDFKDLLEATKEHPEALAAYIQRWMKETGIEEFPNRSEIRTYIRNIKNNQLFYSMDPIKQIGMMYNMTDKGFMSRMINPDQVNQTIRRKGIPGLEVAKAKTGDYYFKYKGRFINPFKQYQLESKDGRAVNRELKDKLLNWAATHGIKIETMEEMFSRYTVEESSTESSATSVADLLNKIISIDPNKEKMDTLAEEISHFATAILKDDVSFKKAMENITETETYKEVKEDYKNIYSSEEQFKKEAVDKLLAQAIVDNFQKTEENKGFIAYLKAIFEKFWKRINKNIKGTDAEIEIRESLFPIAQRILENDYMGDVELDNISPEESRYFQIEEEEELSTEPAEGKTKSEKDKVKQFLDKNLTVLEGRLEKLTRQSNIKKQSTIDRLQAQIKNLKKDIKENKFKRALLEIVTLVKQDLEQTNKVLDTYLKNNTTNGSTFDLVNNFIDVYKNLFDNFSQEIERFGFRENVKKEYNTYINEINRLIYETDKKNQIIGTNHFVKVIDNANTDANGEKIDKDIDGETLVDSVEADLPVLRLYAGNFKNTASKVIRSVFKLIHNSNIKVKRKAIEVAQDLAAAQELMEKSGVKQSDLIEVDSKGRFTQYLIREKNWAPFIEAKRKMQEDLTKTLGFEEYIDVISAVKNKELSKEKLEIFKKTTSKFKEDYPLTTVVDENGNTYKEPKEKNPKFARLMQNPAAKLYYDLLIKYRKEALDKLPLKYRRTNNLYIRPGIRSQFLERMFRKDVSFTKNLAFIATEALFKDQDDTEFGDDQSTLDNKLVPIYFTRKFKEGELGALTTDLTKSYTVFAEMAENFKEKNVLAGDLETVHNQLSNNRKNYFKKYSKKLVKGAASTEAKTVRFLLDSHIYGLEKIDVTVGGKVKENKFTKAMGIAGKEFSVTKLINRFTTFIRDNNLALNLATSTAGALKGAVDSIIEDQIGEYTTIESKNWARLEYGKNLAQVLSQIGRKTQTNKMHLILRRNRVVDINSILTNTERSKLTSTLLNKEMFYVNYKTADYALKGRVALATYHNTRLVDGIFMDKAEFRRLRRKEGKSDKEINSEWKSLENKNLYNAFEVKDAQLVVKDEFKPYVTEALENKVFGRIDHIANIVDGTLSDTDRGALSRAVLGDFLLMHRGWLINTIDSRLNPKSINLITGKEEMGYYPAVWEYFKQSYKQEGYKGILTALTNNHWKKVRAESPGVTKGVKKALLDLIYLNVIGFLAALTNVAADDDKEKEDYTLQFTAYVLNRVLLEHSSGNPLLKPSEMLQIIDEPVVGVRMIKDLVDLSEAFSSEEYESGMYKNWTHREKWWARKIPTFKNIYEMQFPDKKNNFIKNQILNSYIYELMKEDDEDEDNGGGVFNRFKAVISTDRDADPIQTYNLINDEYED